MTERAKSRATHLYEVVETLSRDLISLHDAQGEFLFASANLTRLYGWTQEQLQGRSLYELVHPDDLAGTARERLLLADRLPMQVRLRCADATYRWVETSCRLQRPEGEAPEYVCLTRDVHDERLANERTRAAERALLESELQAMRVRLVSAIAHEVNNPLAVAVGNAGYLRTHPSVPAQKSTVLHEELELALIRVRDVVRELQTLVQEHPGLPERLDLAIAIRRVTALTRGDSEVSLELDPVEVQLVRARVYQLIYQLLAVYGPGAPGKPLRLACSVEGAWASLHLEGIPQWHPGTRVDLFAALRGIEVTAAAPLALAERIARELGGSLEAETLPASQQIRVRLPLAA